MFIRVKRRELSYRDSESRSESRYSLHFVLVESYRSDGKPMQRIIKYLGSINSDDLQDRSRRHSFQQKLHKKLDELEIDGHMIAALKMRLVRILLRH